jgi:L-lysine exporter family protein LysE/ArgO
MGAAIAPLAAGFALGAGLIIAIGAQNAYVLRHGLRRDRVVAVVAVCVLCDWVLIAAGAAGFGTLVRAVPSLTTIAAWGGAAFLAAFGAMAFRSAMRPGVLRAGRDASPGGASIGAAVGATLAVSLLNPHVYLDTVVLLGSVAAQYAMPGRAWFALGAACASLVWFASLGFGARLLAPLFARPVAWRVLDALVGCVMWWIAASLALGQLGVIAR